MESPKNDFFSNTNPNLINSEVLNNLNNRVIIDSPTKTTSTLSTSIKDFYKKYVQQNIIPIIIIVLFVTFMIYRYMTHKTEITEKFDPSKALDDPTQTTLELHETSNHHDLDNVINNIVNAQESSELDRIITDDRLYDNLYKPDENDREMYNGIKNRFENDKPIMMDHPYGYDNDFMTMENNMLRFSTERNKTAVDEASSLVFS